MSQEDNWKIFQNYKDKIKQNNNLTVRMGRPFMRGEGEIFDLRDSVKSIVGVLLG